MTLTIHTYRINPIPVMMQKLASENKAEVTVTVTAFKLLLLRLPCVGSLPLPTFTSMALCSKAVLPSPRTISAPPELCSHFLVHLLLHQTMVIFFFSLKVVLVQDFQSPLSDLRQEANAS